MNLTDFSLLIPAILSVGVSNIRSGSTEYKAIDGVRVSLIASNRLRFEQGFEYLKGLSPEVKSQVMDININGSSPSVYTNKPGVSHNFVSENTSTHHYKGVSWKYELGLGISMAEKNFDLSFPWI